MNLMSIENRPDPCQRQACKIQDCLQKMGYQQSKCEDVINSMKRCCEKYEGRKSVCCSGFVKDLQKHKQVANSTVTTQDNRETVGVQTNGKG